ncbi:MAG: hypothetical protein V4685_10980 [Bacteroidota bacterium]
MKSFMSLCTLLLFTANCFCQQWTDEQLQKANTFFDEYRLSDTEKEVIKYINLCRLYPVEFAEKELKNYEGLPGIEDKNFTGYKSSLLKELSTKQSCNALQPDDLLYDDAKCYSDEISKNKRKPHERVNCTKRNYGECLYFGSGEAKHIAMQWLIDSGIESLAHRKMCLLPAYKKAGIKVTTHFEYKFCSVLELGK